MSAEAGTRLTSPLVVESEFYTPRQLAQKLNCSLKAVQKWTAQRRIPCVKIGYHWRYPVVEINKRLLSGQLLSPEEKA
jgi:excisionase family DNA binding protein